MKDTLKNAWKWLIRSSENPQKVGLTVKGFLLFVLAQVTAVAPYSCTLLKVCIDTGVLGQIVEPVVGIVTGVLTIVSYIVMFIGIARKVVHWRWAAPA